MAVGTEAGAAPRLRHPRGRARPGWPTLRSSGASHPRRAAGARQQSSSDRAPATERCSGQWHRGRHRTPLRPRTSRTESLLVRARPRGSAARTGDDPDAGSHGRARRRLTRPAHLRLQRQERLAANRPPDRRRRAPGGRGVVGLAAPARRGDPGAASGPGKTCGHIGGRPRRDGCLASRG